MPKVILIRRRYVIQYRTTESGPWYDEPGQSFEGPGALRDARRRLEVLQRRAREGLQRRLVRRDTTDTLP